MSAQALTLDPDREVAAADSSAAFGLDEAGFRAFYESTVRPLRGYALRVCGNEDIADEVVQEAYYRLLRSRFEPESERHRKNYLFRIATNLLNDHFRRRRWRRLPLEKAPEPAARDDDVGLRRDLHRVLMRLRPRDRQLLWLAHAEGLSHREIAAVLGLREGSIRLLVFRARRKLADLLAGSGIGPEVLS